MPKKIEQEVLDKIKYFVEKGFTDIEISKELDMGKNSVSLLRQRYVGPNSNYINKNTKHKHLHKKALTIFKDNSFEETARKLNLSISEMKSCFSSAYRNKHLKHIRKDKRRKDNWSNKELKKMLQMIGLRPRHIIAEKIKRGNARVIKEKLRHVGLVAPKYLNGLTVSKYRKMFNVDPDFYLVTDAGPGRGKHSATFFKIVPWIYIQDQINSNEINPEKIIKKWVNAMAELQEWVHENNAYANLLEIVSEI